MDTNTPYVGGPGDNSARRLPVRLLVIGLCSVVGVVLVGLLAFHFLKAKTPPKQSAEKPLTIAITGIKQNDVVAQDTTVTVDINEPSRVARVEYYIDGDFAGVTYALPFSFELKTAKLSEGKHSVLATVYDKKGKSYDSRKVTITIQLPADETTPAAAATEEPKSPISDKKPTPGGSQATGSVPSGGSSSGGTAADTSAPTGPSTLLLSADDGYTVRLSWHGSTDNVGVSGYRVSRDGTVLGTATSTQYTDQTVVPGNTYAYSVVAFDAAGNDSVSSGQPSVTLVPTSVWVDADSPQNASSDTTPIELGVKFKPLVDGMVSGVRFYKPSTSSGTHVGTLWSSGGANLGSVTFQNETASGWQQAAFSTPVSVTSGTTYVVSYSSPSGQYGYTNGYFTTDGITSQYLTAPNNTDAGGNGVFTTSVGTVPNSSFNATNYWVDALFVPNEGAGGPTVTAVDTSTVHPGFPGSDNTGVPVGKRLPVRDRGIVVNTADATIENIWVNGEVDIRADNATIKNSRINSIIYLDRDQPTAGTWYVTIEDSTVNAGAVQRAAISLGQYTIRRSNIYGGQTSALCAADCQVYDSWLHGQYMPPDQPWHLGGFLSNGGADMLLSHNTISCDIPNNIAGGGCSGDLNLYGDFEAIARVTITGNLLTANQDAGYCLAAGYNAFKTFGPGANTVIVTDNIFQRGTTNLCAGFGPVTDYMVSGSPAPGNVWTNNLWDDGTAVTPQ